MGSLSLLQGIFPTQGLNLGLPRCRWILYQLSLKGSPRILEWVAYRFSRGSPQLRNQTSVPWIAGGFFNHWTMWEATSVQFSSVAQSCPTLCDPMNLSKPGLPVHHQIPEFTQTHVHQVGDAIQPSHPLLSPSPPAPNPSQSFPMSQLLANNGFPDSSVCKESAYNAGDPGSIPGSGRSPGEGKGYPLQYSGLENSMDCIGHRVTKNQTWLRQFHFHFW